MKNILAICLFSLIGFTTVAQDATPVVEEEKMTLDGPYIAFFEKSFDFKDINQGDKVEHVFEFENSGTTPLVISNVMTTCGCTAPDWPREPIAPGATSAIKVVFNSRGKVGRQNKVITIVSNATNNPEKIKIVTNVLVPQTTESSDAGE